MTTRTPELAMVWAQDRDGIIGNGGGIPWYLPEDLKHFQKLTHGHPVIMGRKTWDSLPVNSRPLKGRANIVVTRQDEWSAEGTNRAGSLEDAIRIAGALRLRASSAFVIGGGELYREAECLATRAYVTTVDTSVTGDTTAPALDERWKVREHSGWLTARSGLRYRIDMLERR